MPLRTLARLGVLTALAVALMLAEVPIPFLFPGYLKYDASEVPALLAALGGGPWPGLAVEALKDLLFLASGRSDAGWVGIAANFLAGGTFVVVAGWAARLAGIGAPVAGGEGGGLPPLRYWLAGSAVIGAATAAMAAVMVPAGALVFLPLWGIRQGTWAVALGAIAPFNLFKGALTGVLGLALHRRLAGAGAPAWTAARRPAHLGD